MIFLLSVFGKDTKNVIAIVAENAVTIKEISDLKKCRFVGFYSSRYNLAMKDFLQITKPFLRLSMA